MIITTIMGGFGNQLFQYAAGRALAMRTGRALWLDATRMPSPADRTLRRFDLPLLPLAPDVRIIRRPGTGGRERAPSRLMLRVDHHVRRVLGRWSVTEPESDDRLIDLSAPPMPLAMLFGYWQSYRYHEGAEEALRRELTPAIVAGGRVARILEGVGKRDLVTVHVRRGDYVSDAGVAARFGARTAEYFRAATRLIAARCDRPTFVVLSDDPVWAAENVHPDAPTLHPELTGPLEPLEVLAVMSRSRHAVISNSSLSWWGARLAEHPDQVVVAPSPWYVGRPSDAAHRLPPHWLRLDR